MPVRVAELLGSLSLATDLADGFSLEKSLRTTVLAVRLARLVTGDLETLRLVFWSTLLRFAGCTAFAHEEARDFAAGDDLSLRRTLALVDFGRPMMFVRHAVRDIAPNAPLGQRVRAVGRLLSTPSAPLQHARAQCDAGAGLARALCMPAVAGVLTFRDERWDGRGPRALGREEELPFAARAADVADVAELYAWNFGAGEALDELERRSGGALEPRLVDTFSAHAGELWRDLFGASAWELFLAAEPEPWLESGRDGAPAVTDLLEAFGRFADLASVYTLGHAHEVGRLAQGAAAALGLPGPEQELALHAGLAHDLGRVAVPLGIWEKRGGLSPFERERVRTHSQSTETILRLSPSLAAVAEVAAQTHERGSGQGYHRRVPIGSTSLVARAVAAADVAVALASTRPHRERLGEGARAQTLRALGRAGELDARAVDAVLEAVGGPGPRRPTRTFGLTARELEVVRLVAVGRTNPEIGRLLDISPRTAQRHVMNVYDKLGVESRAGLALAAMEHGLLDH